MSLMKYLEKPKFQPKRVKIQYRKKLPPNTKKVDRSTRYGNFFKIIRHGGTYTLEESLYNYEQQLILILEDNPSYLNGLKGYNIVFHFPEGSPCHGKIILRYV